MVNTEFLQDSQNLRVDIFLLTKPPESDRAKICLQLIERSKNAILYLAGDGVYNLLNGALEAMPKERIFVCKEDLEARGVQPEFMPTMLADFYERLLEDLMIDGNKIYTF